MKKVTFDTGFYMWKRKCIEIKLHEKGNID